MAISPDERTFFPHLGARIAKLRKAQGITQIQNGKGAIRLPANDQFV